MKFKFIIIVLFFSTLTFGQIENTPEYKNFEALMFEHFEQFYTKNYDDALKSALKAREIAEQNFKTDEYYLLSLNSVANVYLNLKEYLNAINIHLEVKEIKKMNLGDNHSDYLILLKRIGDLYFLIGDYDNALSFYLEENKKLKLTLDKNHPNYATSLDFLGHLYKKIGDFKNAIKNYKEANEIWRIVLGENHPDYAESLNFTGLAYAYLENHSKALEYYLKAQEIWASGTNKNTLKNATALNNIASVYLDLGDFEKSLIYLLKAREIQESLLGKNHVDYATTTNNISIAYSELGDYQKAIEFCIVAKDIRKDVLGEKSPDYAMSLNNLASNLAEIGDFEESLNYNFKALEIWKAAFGENHPDYAMSLNNIASIYTDLGDYKKAIQFYNKSKEIRNQLLGNEHPDYANTLINLGAVYSNQKDYEKALACYDEGKDILKNSLRENNPDYIQALNNIGLLYTTKGDYQNGLIYLLQAEKLKKLVLGENHPSYALTLSNIGLTYARMHDFKKAEQFLLKSKNIRLTNFGKNHIDYLASINDLSDFYLDINEIEKAIQLKLESNKIFISQLESIFKFRSEKEKKEYLNKNMFLYRDIMPSLAYSTNYENEDFLITVVNNALIHKGLLLNASKNILPKLSSLNNEEVNSKITQYKSKQRFITKQLQLSQTDRVKELSKHEDSLNSYEVELTKLYVKHFKGDVSIIKDWKSISLNENEIAIEFSHFDYHYKTWTDSTMYVAYIFKKGWKLPKAIPLFEEKELKQYLKTNSSPNETYAVRGSKAKSTKVGANSNDLYNLIWQPLEPYLTNEMTVYFSPDGLLHKIPFAALAKKGESLLSENYNLVQLSTTANISNMKADPNFDEIVFMGGIDYDYTPKIEKQKESKIYTELETLKHIQGTRSMGSSWNYLPGTLNEVNTIKNLFKENNKAFKILTQREASETAFKNLSGSSPSVLHIATHGFFFENLTKENPDQLKLEQHTTYTLSKDPLLRSGLIFAGANYAWKHGNNPYEKEDGILTALEISNLDLSNVNMVVLSACETGLGDIDGSEGVYGLQRAFKMAGVDIIVMSLWQVPDKETAEFMNHFYSNWLTGMKVREAFNQTQRTMSKKYKNEPEKWAAFVLFE